LTVNNAADTVHAGNGWTLVMAGQGSGPKPGVADLPPALCVAELAVPLFMAGGGGPPGTAVPVYVREDVARKPKKSQTENKSCSSGLMIPAGGFLKMVTTLWRTMPWCR